jgi:hypothetical protein
MKESTVLRMMVENTALRDDGRKHHQEESLAAV